MTPEQHLQAHRARGRTFEAAGVGSFVRDEGAGPTVLCIHGVPSSSFGYRKLLAALGERGLRGVSFDLPGLGLADRPSGFDYSFTGLGSWCDAAVRALGLDRFHLVIHDLGGPVGLELAAARPERLRSLTILNTIILVAGFKKPWVMRPFEWRGIGELYLATMNRFAFTRLMHLQGVLDRTALSPSEAGVYLELLRNRDGGRAFLEIMRSFETTPEKEALYVRTIRELQVPVQFIWGAEDPALTMERHGLPARSATGVEAFHRLSARHFLQEEQAPAIAELIAGLVREAP